MAKNTVMLTADPIHAPVLTRGTIYLNTKKGPLQVDAYLANCCGYSFGIHRYITGNGTPGKSWSVTETGTGLGCSPGTYPTRKDAQHDLHHIAARLDIIDPEQMKEYRDSFTEKIRALEDAPGDPAEEPPAEVVEPPQVEQAAEEPEEKAAPLNPLNPGPEYFESIAKILKGLPGIHFEIVGCFFWVTGNTYPNRDALKTAGFKWSKSKSAWYKSPEGYARGGRKKYSLGYIRMKYGIQYAEDTQAE